MEERLFTKEEEIVVARALANAIDIILNNGEGPDILAELLGLDEHDELRKKFIGIYNE